jgi:trans-aconitate methyltransferase
MRHRPEDDWEELARREPHYAVLTDEQFRAAHLDDAALKRFHASGEADVARLFDLVSQYLGRTFAPKDALDFGCGVGRLTLALGRRVERVVGVDAAPTMLRIAESQPGSHNAEFRTTLPDAPIDFACSLIVFQHIPVAQGEEILRSLLKLLRPGGAAAVHFTFTRPGGVWKRIGRALRGSSPIVHKTLQALQRDTSRLPYMQMNTYDRERLARIVRECGCREPQFVPFDQGEIGGAILITERP